VLGGPHDRQAAARSSGRPRPESREWPRCSPLLFSRGHSPACLTSARGLVNRVGSPISDSTDAAPIADSPGMEVTSSVSSSSQHRQHPGLDLFAAHPDRAPVDDDERGAFERAVAVPDQPDGVLQGGEHAIDDLLARAGHSPTRQFPAYRGANGPGPSVAPVPGRRPGRGAAPPRSRRTTMRVQRLARLQHRRPHALQQISQLLPARHRLGQQPGAPVIRAPTAALRRPLHRPPQLTALLPQLAETTTVDSYVVVVRCARPRRRNAPGRRPARVGSGAGVGGASLWRAARPEPIDLLPGGESPWTGVRRGARWVVLHRTCWARLDR
jgi:hypothetical protein